MPIIDNPETVAAGAAGIDYRALGMTPAMPAPRAVPFQEPPAISVATLTDVAFQRCISPVCGATYGVDEVRVACDVCGSLLDVVYDWDRLRPPDVVRVFRAEMGAPERAAVAQRRLAVSRAAAVRPAASRSSPSAKGRRCCSPRAGVGKYVGLQAGRSVSAIRGDESLGQLQRQRHDGRVHARPAGRRQAGRLRLDRQHQRLAGPVLLGHAS